MADPQSQAHPCSFLPSDGPQSYSYRKESASYPHPYLSVERMWQKHLNTDLQNKWKQSI